MIENNFDYVYEIEYLFLLHSCNFDTYSSVLWQLYDYSSATKLISEDISLHNPNKTQQTTSFPGCDSA